MSINTSVRKDAANVEKHKTPPSDWENPILACELSGWSMIFASKYQQPRDTGWLARIIQYPLSPVTVNWLSDSFSWWAGGRRPSVDINNEMHSSNSTSVISSEGDLRADRYPVEESWNYATGSRFTFFPQLASFRVWIRFHVDVSEWVHIFTTVVDGWMSHCRNAVCVGIHGWFYRLMRLFPSHLWLCSIGFLRGWNAIVSEKVHI